MLAATEAAMTTTALAKPILCEVTHANNDPDGGSRTCRQPVTAAVGDQRQHTLTLTHSLPEQPSSSPLSPTVPIAYATRPLLVACSARMLTKMMIRLLLAGK